MNKVHTFILIFIMFVLSVALYVAATQIDPELSDIEEQQISVDCAQCEYLPKGSQQDACIKKYDCK
tara:strand:- start:2730 stop:2927 length:198 start_codon:yes stop_codon:yes gene_type:complete